MHGRSRLGTPSAMCSVAAAGCAELPPEGRTVVTGRDGDLGSTHFTR